MRSDAQRNRNLIIEAARAMFTSHGTTASLDEIAVRAGVGSGTLYRRFPTRDDLIAACMKHDSDALLTLANDLLADPDPHRALREWTSALLRVATLYEGLSGALLDAMARPESPLSLAYIHITDGMSRLIERAQERGRIRADLDTNELGGLVLALASAVAHERARAAAGERLLDLLFEGFDHRP